MPVRAEHFPEKWSPISGIPEIGTQCRPSRLKADLGGFPQKMRPLKKLARASDSTDWKSALEVEIGVGFRRRYPRQRLGEQRTERWSRLHARVPGLRDFVFVPRHIAQIVRRRQMRCGGKVG